MRILIQFSPVPWPRVARSSALALLVATALYFLWRIRDVLTPFLIAFFIASLLDPVVTRMQKRGISRGRAVAAIFGVTFLVIFLGALLLGRAALPQMRDLATNAQIYSNNLVAATNRFYNDYRKPLGLLGVKENKLSAKSGPVADAVSRILSTLNATLVGLAGQVLWLVLIPLSVVYLLFDYPTIRARLLSFVPDHQRGHVDRMSAEVVEIFSDYARSLSRMCLLYGLIATLLFLVLRLRYALFLGPAAGVLYAVPYVGPATALATSGVVALTTGGSIGYVALVMGLFALMHVLVDNVVTPRVVGGSVGLHPLVNIFALMCGATLFGVWGMLLAVPVAASIQMLLFYFFPRLAARPVRQRSDDEPAAEQADGLAADVPAPEPAVALAADDA